MTSRINLFFFNVELDNLVSSKSLSPIHPRQKTSFSFEGINVSALKNSTRGDYKLLWIITLIIDIHKLLNV